LKALKEDLVTFFVYPAHAGHDYATIDVTGFRKRVFEFNGVATIVDNHTFARQRSDSW
jgi:glucose-6-phosphate isomerase